MKLKKIFIIGISGSGKSFLADILSKKLKLPNIDLDDIYWEKKYTKKQDEEECKIILSKKIKNKESWIAEGIYDSWTTELMEKADIIIWLDLPKNLLSWRIFKRWWNRRKIYNEDFFGMLSLIKFQRNYRKIRKGESISFYNSHKKYLDPHKEKVILIKIKKELNSFLKKIDEKKIEI